jgi:predicted Zn-dependent peptidase
VPPVQRFTLKNGLQVIVVPRKELPVVSFGIAVQAGGYDEARHAGRLRLRRPRCSARAKTRSADESRTRSISSAARWTRRRPTRARTRLLGAVEGREAVPRSAVGHPAAPLVPESEMGEVRDEMLRRSRRLFDNPARARERALREPAVRREAPRRLGLTADDVRKITARGWRRLEDVLPAEPRHLPSPATSTRRSCAPPSRRRSAAGDARRFPPRPAWTIPKIPGTRILLVDRPDSTQATFVLGHQGIKHADPRWYAATLLNYVLGGSDFASRLMIEVRAKRGLTYGIGSSFGSTLYQSAFRVAGATKSESTWDALLASVNEIRRMKAEGPTVLELDKAKGYYAGSYPFKLQTAAGVAQALVAAELHGLGAGYVRELPLRLAAVDQAAAKAAGASCCIPTRCWW